MSNKAKILIVLCAVSLFFASFFSVKYKVALNKADKKSAIESEECFKHLTEVADSMFYSKNDKTPVKINCKTATFINEIFYRLRVDCDLISKVNSAVRSQRRNDEVGGVPDSAHIYGWAADISCSDSQTKYLIVKLAVLIAEEWGDEYKSYLRVGIYANHIHIDFDPSKPSNVLWADNVPSFGVGPENISLEIKHLNEINSMTSVAEVKGNEQVIMVHLII